MRIRVLSCPCACACSQTKFTSSNGMCTTSETEWEFVLEPAADKLYPERADFRTPSGQEIEDGKCRRKRPIADPPNPCCLAQTAAWYAAAAFPSSSK